MAVSFSLVIPAYNEVNRLPAYLSQVREYLDGPFSESDIGDLAVLCISDKKSATNGSGPTHAVQQQRLDAASTQYEVLVVDDGSTDGTWEMLREAAQDWPQLSLLRHTENRGKGAAVCTGVAQACGRAVLFADADGATPIAEERRLRAALNGGADVAVGSRMVTSNEITCRRKWTRKLVGRLFASVVKHFVTVPVKDTQCGFKMFQQDAARDLFSRATETGYLLDLELLILCKQLGYTVAEVPVHWHEVTGSKLSLSRDWRQILTDLRRLQRRSRSLAPNGFQGSERSV